MVSSVGFSGALASSGLAKNSAPARATSQAASEPRESKVEALARQIKEGSYKLDLDSLAKKIAEELI